MGKGCSRWFPATLVFLALTGQVLAQSAESPPPASPPEPPVQEALPEDDHGGQPDSFAAAREADQAVTPTSEAQPAETLPVPEVLNQRPPVVYQPLIPGAGTAAPLILPPPGPLSHKVPEPPGQEVQNVQKIPAYAGSAGCVSPGSAFWPRLKGFLNKALFNCNNQEVPSLPLGATVYKPFQIQVGNAIASRMALYEYDFLLDDAQLNPRGKERVAWIAGKLGHYPGPVIVEPTPCNPPLAEARRLAVLKELLHYGPVPEQLVVIGPPLSRGLHGPENVLLYNNLLSNTADGGQRIGPGGPTPGPGTGRFDRPDVPLSPIAAP